MENTKIDPDKRWELAEKISHVLNYTDAYKELHKLLVDREQVLLHSEMENLATELEELIVNWTITDDYD